MNEKQTGFLTIGILLIIVVLVGIYTYQKNIAYKNALLPVSEATLSLSTENEIYTALDGTAFDLAQFDGKVRVVNSWASWCPFCVQELPDLEKLAEEYDEKNVVVIAINRNETPASARSFLSSLGELDDIVFILDKNDFFYKSIGGFSMPETIFYDTAGNIIVHKRGFMNFDEMKKHTEKALRDRNNKNET